MSNCLYSDNFGGLDTGALFLQWKGIDICSDFHCECGAHVHVCGVSFVYQIECGSCGAIWELPHTVPLKRVHGDSQPTVLAKEDGEADECHQKWNVVAVDPALVTAVREAAERDEREASNQSLRALRDQKDALLASILAQVKR